MKKRPRKLMLLLTEQKEEMELRDTMPERLEKVNKMQHPPRSLRRL